MPLDIFWRIIIIVIGVVILGTVLYTFLSGYTGQSCRQQFIDDIQEFENKACTAELFDEPIQEKLDLRTCVEYVIYESGKLIYKFSGEEGDREEFTNCPDGSYVEYVGFSNSSLQVSKNNGIQYDITIKYREIALT